MPSKVGNYVTEIPVKPAASLRLSYRHLLEAVVRVLEGEGDRLPKKDQGGSDMTQVPNPFG